MKGNPFSDYQRYEFLMYDPVRIGPVLHDVERMGESTSSSSRVWLTVGYAPLVVLGIAGLVAILAIAERWFI